MKVYCVVKESSGAFVCGPFKSLANAELALDGYNGVWCWGKCRVIEKEIADRKEA